MLTLLILSLGTSAQLSVSAIVKSRATISVASEGGIRVDTTAGHTPIVSEHLAELQGQQYTIQTFYF